MKPIYLEWDNVGLCGIAGKSGSGKSNTIRFLIAQLALARTAIVLIDGHGTAAQDSVTKTTACIHHTLLLPPATTPTDGVAYLRRAEQIAQSRLDRGYNEYPIAVIVDEVITLLRSVSEHDRNECIRIMERFATDFRKTDVKLFIAAQNWTQDFIGSASLRRSMNRVILHNMALDTVKYFTGDPIVRKKISFMQTGEAFILGDGAPIFVKVPYISQDDLAELATLPASETVLESMVKEDDSFTDVSPPFSPLQSRLPIVSPSLETQIYGLKTHSEKGKIKAIREVFNCSPGKSSRYKAASKLWDALAARGYFET